MKNFFKNLFEKLKGVYMIFLRSARNVVLAIKKWLKNLDHKKIKRFFIIIVSIFVSLCVLVAIYALTVNAYLVNSTKQQIITADEAAKIEGFDCIIVLGCQVKADGSPSHMLRDRLTRAVELYKSGVAPKILMSGDHGRTNYNEVKTMKQFAIDNGVKSEDIFMDHAGFSTYETVYRARDIFKCKKAVIVTQEYHLYRALYIGNALGVELYGVTSDYNRYYGQTMRDIREILARNKDFLTSIFKPKPTFLGEEISIKTNGDITNDYK